jgi:hypothetical protein
MSDMSHLDFTFHHLGLAVRRPLDAKRFLGGLGYEMDEPVFDPEQNANLIMCRHAGGTMPTVEIIYPGENKSPVDALVNLRPDGLVYHMCYVTPNLGTALQWMEENGVRAVCVVPATRAVLFNDNMVSFYNIVGVGLCEIIEDPGRIGA